MAAAKVRRTYGSHFLGNNKGCAPPVINAKISIVNISTTFLSPNVRGRPCMLLALLRSEAKAMSWQTAVLDFWLRRCLCCLPGSEQILPRIQIRSFTFSCALGSRTWRAFRVFRSKTRWWTAAFRCWQRLIFRVWAGQRATGTTPYRHCAEVRRDFAPGRLLWQNFLALPICHKTFRWGL